MKNVHNAAHMIDRGTGDIIVTSSLAAHFPRRGASVCLVQVGGELFPIADRAPPGVQARHPRGLYLARAGHHLAAGRLA